MAPVSSASCLRRRAATVFVLLTATCFGLSSAAGLRRLPGSELTVGKTIVSNTYIASPKQQSFLLLQSDGNLVLYRGTPAKIQAAIWSTKTGRPGAVTRFALLQGDGNFVLYDGTYPGKIGEAAWAAKTKGATRLRVLDEGKIALYDAAGKAVWVSSGTVGPIAPPPNRPTPAANQPTAYVDPPKTLPGGAVSYECPYLLGYSSTDIKLKVGQTLYISALDLEEVSGYNWWHVKDNLNGILRFVTLVRPGYLKDQTATYVATTPGTTRMLWYLARTPEEVSEHDRKSCFINISVSA